MERKPKNFADLGTFVLTGEEWITSDTHFGHRNVALYCGRPWADPNEMDTELIKRWNSVVKPDDVIFHLGDFAFKGPTFKRDVLQKLNGYKILIKGNHDAGRPKMIDCGFDEAYLVGEGVLDYGKTKPSFSMSHVPLPMLAHTSFFHLCGHVHEKWCFIAPNIYNVGCDQWDFTPQTINTVLRTAAIKQMSLPVQHTMDTWFEPRDEQIVRGMYGTTQKGSLAE